MGIAITEKFLFIPEHYSLVRAVLIVFTLSPSLLRTIRGAAANDTAHERQGISLDRESTFALPC